MEDVMDVRRTPARAATEDRILDAARHQVMDKGWERFSLRALARDVKLSPASLYEYFDGKDAILEAVADRARRRLIDQLRSVEAHAPNRLVELAMAYVGFARQYRADFMLLFARGRESAAPGKNSPYSIWLAQAAREAGGDPHAMAYGVWACAHGLAMLQLTELDAVEGDFEGTDRRTVEALVTALA
jgi:AcrR family transcriptional regulator